MIRPEQKTHTVKAYVTQTRKGMLKIEAKKRGVGISELIKIALFEYLSPKEVPKSRGIVRIDRTPKGKITIEDVKALQNENNFIGVMVELKQHFARERRKK